MPVSGSAAKWLIGWTMLGLAAAGTMIESLFSHRWLAFVLATIIVVLCSVLQAVCAKVMEHDLVCRDRGGDE